MRKTTAAFLFSIFFLFCSGVMHGAIPSWERAALIALYNSTNGDSWDNKVGWKNPPLDIDGFAEPGTEYQWYGITCDGSKTTVTKIALPDNNLYGTIPPELGDLSNLQYLYLGSNQLTGSIPPELGSLLNLESLYLHSNQLEGSIPPELGNLSNLTILSLGSNQLEGSIPPELGNLSNLTILSLSSNQLEGSIPPELGNLSNLNFLSLGNNALYTDDDVLSDLLNTNDPDWGNIQTTTPTDVSATASSESSIDVSWTPIIYTGDTGGYRVFYSTTSGGPYNVYGQTTDKTVSSMQVTGLNPGTWYYFVVQTRTDPHGSQQNTVDSEYSAETSANTSYAGGTIPFAYFVLEEAKIDFKKKPDDDKIHMKGRFELGLDSDGVDISEDVIVTIGLFTETIKMKAKGKGNKWEYKRPKGENGIKHMKIDWKKKKKKNHYAEFEIRVDKADLGDMASWTNPLTVTLQIGNDLGNEEILMKEKKHHWDYHKKKHH